jgi:hypothetical protein
VLEDAVFDETGDMNRVIVTKWGTIRYD